MQDKQIIMFPGEEFQFFSPTHFWEVIANANVSVFWCRQVISRIGIDLILPLFSYFCRGRVKIGLDDVIINNDDHVFVMIFYRMKVLLTKTRLSEKPSLANSTRWSHLQWPRQRQPRPQQQPQHQLTPPTPTPRRPLEEGLQRITNRLDLW